MLNLLSNALKFTPEGGRIRITGEPAPSNESVHIAVYDSGIGLERDDLETIFAPFEQAVNEGIGNYQGTGLGLSLTRNLVEMHGGRIWAESSGTGMGAAFHFTIPTTTEST